MSQDLETIELSIKHAKKSVDLMKSLDRLTRNRDFKALFLEGYFEKEPVRLVTLKADPNMQDAESQEAIIKQMDAIGTVRQYLSGILQMGRMAEKAIADDEATREEMLAEELDA
jgi:predicted ATPase with chaperone activity